MSVGFLPVLYNVDMTSAVRSELDDLSSDSDHVFERPPIQPHRIASDELDCMSSPSMGSEAAQAVHRREIDMMSSASESNHGLVSEADIFHQRPNMFRILTEIV